MATVRRFLLCPCGQWPVTWLSTTDHSKTEQGSPPQSKVEHGQSMTGQWDYNMSGFIDGDLRGMTGPVTCHPTSHSS